MKREIPLAILEALTPIANKNIELVTPVHEDGVYFKLVDNEVESGFYFKVKESTTHKSSNGKIVFDVEFKPKSREDMGIEKRYPLLEGVVEFLNNWLNLLKSYNEIKTIYDDPILKSYQDYFEADFDIIDDDAKVAPFNLKQQIVLNEYLETAKIKLNELKEGDFKKDEAAIIEIENDIEEIQNNLTKETKSQVIKRLSKMWAKTQKVSLKLLKEISIKISSEIVVKLIMG